MYDLILSKMKANLHIGVMWKITIHMQILSHPGLGWFYIFCLFHSHIDTVKLILDIWDEEGMGLGKWFSADQQTCACLHE